jgi:heme/copper-type cytochrome/quinol oxidase subunit 2
VDELSANVVAEPESVNYVTFTLSRIGTFTYYSNTWCGGHANPTMHDHARQDHHWRKVWDPTCPPLAAPA